MSHIRNWAIIFGPVLLALWMMYGLQVAAAHTPRAVSVGLYLFAFVVSLAGIVWCVAILWFVIRDWIGAR